jgi:hypothetical protein
MGLTKFKLHDQKNNDKHKTIWWEHVNVGQNMTRDDFIWL